MTSKAFAYEADWRQYAYPRQHSHFATDEELEERYTHVRLTPGGTLNAGGMPVVSNGREALINTENEHTLIFGGTASKKTRTLMLPLIPILAQARESMVVMDIKGELSNGSSFPAVRQTLEEYGYNCVFFNLREMNGDAYNLLLEPYRLYKSGERDEAISMVNDIIESLASIYHDTKADPFWEMTAKHYLVSVTTLLFELCKEESKVNMLSLASYTDWNGSLRMGEVADNIHIDNNIMAMLRSVTSEPEKTKMSTMATVSSMLTRFLTNEKLLRMLSQSTFDLHDLGKKPTALFIIMPDEVDSYAPIAGLMLQQISATLVRDAYRAGGELPRRVNFLCDEFCNYYVPGMMRAISAHRSRNIRWYLVCQSMKQLQACYPNEADTIVANCVNVYFLNSTEHALLEQLSRQSGVTTITPDGSPAPLVTVEDLQNLKKGWTHTDVYFTTGNLRCVSAMPDVSQYPYISRCKRIIPMPRRVFPAPPIYTAFRMSRDVAAMRRASDGRKQGKTLMSYDVALADAYDKLFQ